MAKNRTVADDDATVVLALAAIMALLFMVAKSVAL